MPNESLGAFRKLDPNLSDGAAATLFAVLGSMALQPVDRKGETALVVREALGLIETQLRETGALSEAQVQGLDTSDTVLSVSTGWHTHLNVLEDVLEEKKPRPFYKMQLKYESEYTERLGLS